MTIREKDLLLDDINIKMCIKLNKIIYKFDLKNYNNGNLYDEQHKEIIPKFENHL
jgi:hypothetical protein